MRKLALYATILVATFISGAPVQAASSVDIGSVTSLDDVLGSEHRRTDILDFFVTDRSIALRNFLDVGASDPVVQAFLNWNEVALTASGQDHFLELSDPGNRCSEPLTYEQFGPHRASRAMAIVHLAMFEAVNAIDGKYQGFTDMPVQDVSSLDRKQVMTTAIAYAAWRALGAVYSYQRAIFTAQRNESLKLITEGPDRKAGIAIGLMAADKVIEKRQGDGANQGNIEGMPVKEPVLVPDDCNQLATPFQLGSGALSWQQDPASRLNIALGANWGKIRPFSLTSGDQFRVPAPPTDIAAFQNQIARTRKLGGDPEKGAASLTERTPTEEFKGVFWDYDGVPALCAPPTL